MIGGSGQSSSTVSEDQLYKRLVRGHIDPKYLEEEVCVCCGVIWIGDRTKRDIYYAVSYTHLTLPTIYSV